MSDIIVNVTPDEAVAVTLEQAPQGPQGIQGPPGDPGPQGDPGPGGIFKVETRTLSAGEITAEKVVLVQTPTTDVLVNILGGTLQEYSVDYTVVGNEVRWTGLGLASLVIAGDKLQIIYTY